MGNIRSSKTVMLAADEDNFYYLTCSFLVSDQVLQAYDWLCY